MRIEKAFDNRNLGVTLFRAVFVTLLLSGLATLYLLGAATGSSAFIGGVIFLIVPVLTLAASLLVYVPAATQLRNVFGVQTSAIFFHQNSADSSRRRDEHDLFDRLEKDLGA